MITAKAPGKLYIAGEYAVVENGYPAILVALNQFVTCSIKVSPADTGRIISEQYHENSLLWRRQGDKMVVDQRDNPFAYILSAISVTEEYARSLDRQLQIYDIYIDSQLDSANGKNMVWVLPPRLPLPRSRRCVFFMICRLTRTSSLSWLPSPISPSKATVHWGMWRLRYMAVGSRTIRLIGNGLLNSANTWICRLCWTCHGLI